MTHRWFEIGLFSVEKIFKQKKNLLNLSTNSLLNRKLQKK